MKYYRIKSLRKEHACTQKQVADYLGVSERKYFNYENGKTRVPSVSLIRLADYYNTSIDYLIGYTYIAISHERRSKNINRET